MRTTILALFLALGGACSAQCVYTPRPVTAWTECGKPVLYGTPLGTLMGIPDGGTIISAVTRDTLAFRIIEYRCDSCPSVWRWVEKAKCRKGVRQ